MKLSKRLQQIDTMVTSQYEHIWDCCCDHGLLGFSLLSRLSTSKLHFVDIVPELMDKVTSKLERFFPNLSWQTHCLDVAKLPLAQYQGKHLIIIAGVGGDLMMQFIAAIFKQHNNLNIDFLLCPVHHQFSLRQKLIALNFSLRDEILIEENRRFYEILLVSSAPDEENKTSPVGDKIWLSTSNKQADIVNRYLQKTLRHYQRILQGHEQRLQLDNAKQVQDIINAYKAKIAATFHITSE